MACKVTQGINNTCDDLRRVGGSGQTFWAGYLSDLATPFDLSQVADITTIDFAAYGGLYRFDGTKFSHQFGSEMSVAQGGNKSWIHTVTPKLLTTSTEDDVTLQNLLLGTDIFIVALDNNQEFFVLGAGAGLSGSEASQNTGQTGDSDTTDTFTLTGQERTKPLRFNLGTYAATLARVEGYEV